MRHELISRRPSGVELYNLHHPLLPSLSVVLQPGQEARASGWEPSQLRGAGLSWTQVLPWLERLVAQRGCQRLLLRVEQGAEVALPSGYEHLLTYHRLSTSRMRLRARACGDERLMGGLTVLEGLTVEPLPSYEPLWGGPFRRVPLFQPWFVGLFHAIFEDGGDPELAASPAWGLAQLELSLAAGWLDPVLWIARVNQEPVGMALMRRAGPRTAELCYVGVLPVWRGVGGVSDELMRVALDALERQGMEELSCLVADKNGRSCGFFEKKWGFERMGEESIWRRQLAGLAGGG